LGQTRRPASPAVGCLRFALPVRALTLELAGVCHCPSIYD